MKDLWWDLKVYCQMINDIGLCLERLLELNRQAAANYNSSYKSLQVNISVSTGVCTKAYDYP